ncbi:hypothetical protein GLOIN_2v1788167 [Rhizophagus irregularis DAOM 181602=DAOM 197198]|nr:hypothetical protein GLOIN_2v1788167 [Rhizophagus irregularis DAOM 181602=DAOM 197198]
MKAKEHLQYVFKSCCIHYKRNVDHYPYCADTKHDMLEILKANSSKEINQIFGQIKMHWLEYYQKPWVLGSLTYHYSLMSYEDWQTTPFNTNIAESAHAMINRTGKSLKLKIAILKGWKHDECIYKRIKIHQQTGIPMSSKDKSDFGKKMQANKRLVKKLSKRATSKGKQRASKKAKIDYDDDDTEMEIEECKIALEERKMQLKQNEIDLKLKELQIKKLEMELNNNQ